VYGFEPILALSHPVHVSHALQKEGEFVTGELFVVDDYRGERHNFSREKYSGRFWWGSTWRELTPKMNVMSENDRARAS
jgi:hypothetical protein